MKCPECGEELESGALFCWACGYKIANGDPTVQYCTACGEPIKTGSKFCANCGAKFVGADVGADDIYLDNEESDEEAEETAEEAEDGDENDTHKDGPFSKFKRWLIGLWDSLDGYSQSCVWLMMLTMYCLILSIVAHNTLRTVMAVLQVTDIWILYCIHNNILIHNAKAVHSRLLWILLIILNIVFIASFRAG